MATLKLTEQSHPTRQFSISYDPRDGRAWRADGAIDDTGTIVAIDGSARMLTTGERDNIDGQLELTMGKGDKGVGNIGAAIVAGAREKIIASVTLDEGCIEYGGKAVTTFNRKAYALLPPTVRDLILEDVNLINGYDDEDDDGDPGN